MFFVVKRHHTFRISRISRLCAALLLLLLLVPPAVSVFSAAAAPAVLSQEEAVINARSTDKDVSFTVASSVKLKSFATGDFEYTMYTLSPYGYAILCDETGALMEAVFAEDAIAPYPVIYGKTFYYSGPGNYIVLENGIYRSLLTGQALQTTDIQTFAALEYEVQSTTVRHYRTSAALQQLNVSPRYGGSIAVSAGWDYFSGLSDFGFNTQGTCTVLAAAILFGYFDEYVDNAFVPSGYEQGNGTSEAFHQYLNDLVYGSNPQGGSYIRDTLNALNQYLSSRGVSERMQSEYSSNYNARYKIITELSDGRPVLASASESLGADWNHTVVVYGAAFDPYYPVETATLEMHTGHHGSTSNYRFVASIRWFYECGYIVD